MKDQLQVRPRLCDTDLNGHINNTAVMPWLEEGRLHLCQQRAAIDQATVLAHLSVDYLAEIEYGKSVVVTTWVVKLGNSSIHYQQQIHQADQLCIAAQAVSVAFDRQNRAKQPLTQASRTALDAYRDSDA